MAAVREVLTGRKPEPRKEWLDVMEATRSEWQAAFEGRPTLFSTAVAEQGSLADGVAEFLLDPWAVLA